MTYSVMTCLCLWQCWLMALTWNPTRKKSLCLKIRSAWHRWVLRIPSLGLGKEDSWQLMGTWEGRGDMAGLITESIVDLPSWRVLEWPLWVCSIHRWPFIIQRMWYLILFNKASLWSDTSRSKICSTFSGFGLVFILALWKQGPPCPHHLPCFLSWEMKRDSIIPRYLWDLEATFLHMTVPPF